MNDQNNLKQAADLGQLPVVQSPETVPAEKPVEVLVQTEEETGAEDKIVA